MLLAAAVILGVVAFIALRSPEPLPVAEEPTPTPTPEPAPTPVAHDPVAGDREIETVVVSEGPIFYRAGDSRNEAPATDDAAVEALVDEVAGWLDAHLTDLQDGGAGLLEDVAAPGLLESGETVELSSGLATFLEPVMSATYRFVVGVDGTPDWAHVRVNLMTGGGDEEPRSAELTFVPTDDGPLLIAAARVDPDDPTMRLPAPPEEGTLR